MTVFNRLRQLEAPLMPSRWKVSGWWFDGPKLTRSEVDFIVAARNLWGPLVAVAEAAEPLRRGTHITHGEVQRMRGLLDALERAVKEQS